MSTLPFKIPSGIYQIQNVDSKEYVQRPGAPDPKPEDILRTGSQEDAADFRIANVGENLYVFTELRTGLGPAPSASAVNRSIEFFLLTVDFQLSLKAVVWAHEHFAWEVRELGPEVVIIRIPGRPDKVWVEILPNPYVLLGEIGPGSRWRLIPVNNAE